MTERVDTITHAQAEKNAAYEAEAAKLRAAAAACDGSKAELTRQVASLDEELRNLKKSSNGAAGESAAEIAKKIGEIRELREELEKLRTRSVGLERLQAEVAALRDQSVAAAAEVKRLTKLSLETSGELNRTRRNRNNTSSNRNTIRANRNRLKAELDDLQARAAKAPTAAPSTISQENSGFVSAGNSGFVNEDDAYGLTSERKAPIGPLVDTHQTLKAPPPRNRTQQSIDEFIARQHGYKAAKQAAPPIGINSTVSARPSSRGTPASRTVRPPSAADRPAGKPSALAGKPSALAVKRRGGSKTQKKGALLRKTSRNIPPLI
jgi:hypothetical protein